MFWTFSGRASAWIWIRLGFRLGFGIGGFRFGFNGDLGLGLVNRWAATTKHILERKSSTKDYKIGVATDAPP